VLHHLHPIDEVRGFTSESSSTRSISNTSTVRNFLTAGSSLRVVARDTNNDAGYLVMAISIQYSPASGRASWR
jgi:hypothetical protein